VAASLRTYQTHLQQTFGLPPKSPNIFGGYSFRKSAEAEISDLLDSTSALAWPGNTDGQPSETPESIRTRLDALKQLESDWTVAVQRLQRLHNELDAASRNNPKSNLLDSLRKIVDGTFGSPGIALPSTSQPFTSDLWSSGNPGQRTGLKYHIFEALAILDLMKRRPLKGWRLLNFLKASPVDLTALKNIIENYPFMTAGKRSIQNSALPSLQSTQMSQVAAITSNWYMKRRVLSAQRPYIYVWLSLALIITIGLLVNYPVWFLLPVLLLTIILLLRKQLSFQRWHIRQLVAIRLLLGFLVAFIIIAFTVVSGFQELYLDNPTWGASLLDYFTALGWGLGLSGGLNLIVGVIENLRFTGKPAA
jgi:hypothetical protein